MLGCGCGSRMVLPAGCTGDHNRTRPHRGPMRTGGGVPTAPVRGWGHALFRWESLLNTPLFVGFAGFVSKLWLAHDEDGVYRGFYEWDGPARAEYYARC